MLITLVGSNVRFKTYPAGRGFFLARVLACTKSFASLVFRVVDKTQTTSCMPKDLPEKQKTSSSRVFKTTVKPGNHSCSNLTSRPWVALTFTILVLDIWITFSGV